MDVDETLLGTLVEAGENKDNDIEVAIERAGEYSNDNDTDGSKAYEDSKAVEGEVVMGKKAGDYSNGNHID